MNVLILYNSKNGHTQNTAEIMAETARQQKHDTVIKAVSQVRAADVEKADVVFVGSWVQGFILFGVKPAGATLWVPSLPDLKGKPVGVFCTYLFAPQTSLRTLASMLEARGAKIAEKHAFHRRHSRQDAEAFAQTVLQQV
jgi:flavodoxin